MRRSILIACAVAVALRAVVAQVEYCDDDVRGSNVVMELLLGVAKLGGAVVDRHAREGGGRVWRPLCMGA